MKRMTNKADIIYPETYSIYNRLNSNENRFFSKKKILLLGSDGFLGKSFLNYFKFLLKNKIYFQLDCVDNNISSFRQKKNKNKFINYFCEDLNKFKKRKKYDIVIFLAGIASPTIYKKFPLEALEVSYLGAKKYLEFSKKDKSLFIFFSSSEIYGNPDSKNLPTSENYYGNVNSFGPRSCYDEGKRVGETLCYIYKEYYKTKVKIIRPFNVFGPTMNFNDDRVIPRFIRAIKKNKPITIYNHGKQTRSFCYITDAMVGFIKVISKGNLGDVYNVGNDNDEVSMNTLSNEIKKLYKKKVNIKKIKYPSFYPSNEPMRRCPNLKKIKKDTGFKPEEIFKVSLLKFVKGF